MRLLAGKAMKEGGVTPYALARDSGGRISKPAAYRIFRGTKGHLSLAELAALCDVLDVEPGELFERERGKKGKRG
jgi:DNA-binding Xre family transcriptional regulator